jgi:Kef-type K+ transport system membrane component KefB
MAELGKLLLMFSAGLEINIALIRRAQTRSIIFGLFTTTVAYDTLNGAGQRMLDGTMLNAVLVLMLATSILGPVLTERFAPRMLEGSVRDTREASA